MREYKIARELTAEYRGWTIVSRRVGSRGLYRADATRPPAALPDLSTGRIGGRLARWYALQRAKELIDRRESEETGESDQ